MRKKKLLNAHREIRCAAFILLVSDIAYDKFTCPPIYHKFIASIEFIQSAFCILNPSKFSISMKNIGLKEKFGLLSAQESNRLFLR